jgi:hypothetical protein
MMGTTRRQVAWDQVFGEQPAVPALKPPNTFIAVDFHSIIGHIGSIVVRSNINFCTRVS